MTAWLFVRPLDVLYLRGNKLFGGAGDHAEALMPPWPSLFAGAIRSSMLARSGVDLGRFTDEAAAHTDQRLAEVLGTPTSPGRFAVSFVGLGRGKRGAEPEFLVPLPADLVVQAARDTLQLVVTRLVPDAGNALAAISTSNSLPCLPLLVANTQEKPRSGFWLTGAGLKVYLDGGTPTSEHLVSRSDLWETDSRLGIARSRDTYTAEEGKLYTTDTVALAEGVGFIVGIDGCDPDLLPADALLRLGGDARGAEVSRWSGPTPHTVRLSPDERFVALLATPGLFPGGWAPPGVHIHPDGVWRLGVTGLTARLAAAAVPRAEVVSGWDLPAHKPKPAQRAVPAGAVYHFDETRGNPADWLAELWPAIAKDLDAIANDTYDPVWKQRRAEGFSNLLLGRWPEGK